MELWELFAVGFLAAIISLLLLKFVTRNTRRRQERSWEEAILVITNGKEKGRAFKIKSMSNGMIELEELEDSNVDS